MQRDHHWHDLHWLFNDRPTWQKAALLVLIAAVIVWLGLTLGTL